MKMRNYFLLVLVAVSTGFAPTTAQARFGEVFEGLKKTLGVGGLSEQEIVLGLKEALRIGAGNAVSLVSKVDGYYRNLKIRIPLPDSVKKAERLVRAAGFGSELDAFERSMNRAAEKAAPEAKSLFLEAVEKMTFSDAKKILGGRNDEATLYFKEKTSDRLRALAKPIVHRSMAQVGVTKTYQDLEVKARMIPFVGNLGLDLDDYVTNKALDGLFIMMAEEERKIREDPAARVTDLLKKVFGGR